ncbi:MAG: uridine kinase, partial [Acidobacteria bacterium]|nr:uridine kinase [Acidobacteriota bacterium]
YLASVRPMHLQFVEPSKRFADVIIPEGGHNQVSIDLLSGNIRARLLEERARRAPATAAQS